MNANISPEYWLRGPVADVPSLLQPVAHALLQAQAEVHNIMHNFTDQLLWMKPVQVASPGFHLQHLTGVLNRLFSYADRKQLTPEQLDVLQNEGKEDNSITIAQLLRLFDEQILRSLNYLKEIDVNTLTDIRFVGRRQIHSTVIGLLFHAAEHTMRHTGQLLVTVQVLKENYKL